MTIVFMSLVAALIAERINLRAGLWLLPILLLIGVGQRVPVVHKRTATELVICASTPLFRPTRSYFCSWHFYFRHATPADPI